MPDSQVPNDDYTPTDLEVEANEALKARYARGANSGWIAGASFAFGILIAVGLAFLAPVFASTMTRDEYSITVVAFAFLGAFFIMLGVVSFALSVGHRKR